MQLPCDPGVVRLARTVVRDACRFWGLDAQCDDAALLVSEVVTNAILHAKGVGPLVVIDAAGRGIRVEVRDGASAGPYRRRRSAEAASGRGLHMIGALARSWGVRRSATGKSVWFELGTA